MHHKTPQKNKPRLITVYFYANDSKGHRFCVGKKTFNATMLIRECVKRKDLICSTETEQQLIDDRKENKYGN